jgi:hypothetical protein
MWLAACRFAAAAKVVQYTKGFPQVRKKTPFLHDFTKTGSGQT